MSLLSLTTETMVTLSERWVDPDKDRKHLTALPLLAPLVPVLQQAHEGLLSKQRTGSAITAEIARNRQEANLALDSKADADTVERLLGPLRRAEAKADRRRAGKVGNVPGGEGEAAKPTDRSSPAADDTLDAEPSGAGEEGTPSPGGATPTPSHKPS